MSLELVSTIASLVTAAVIAATAIVAIVQLGHLRAANQITALLAVQNELDSPDFRAAEVTVREELATMLANPLFCRFEIAMSRRELQTKMDEPHLKVRQAANLIGNQFENIGAMVKNGILDERLVLDIYCWIVSGYWERLGGFIAMARVASGEPSIYENFEYLACLSKRYLKAHPQTYPADMERLEIELPAAAKAFL
jgi:Domain of unknown function (DUF4760)